MSAAGYHFPLFSPVNSNFHLSASMHCVAQPDNQSIFHLQQRYTNRWCQGNKPWMAQCSTAVLEWSSCYASLVMYLFMHDWSRLTSYPPLVDWSASGAVTHSASHVDIDCLMMVACCCYVTWYCNWVNTWHYQTDVVTASELLHFEVVNIGQYWSHCTEIVYWPSVEQLLIRPYLCANACSKWCHSVTVGHD